MASDWLDEIEAQADDTVPYYLPRLIREIRTQRDEIARLSTALAAQPATPPASPEPPPDDLVALVRALQAHAKEADWQDVDDPIQALLAWEPAASPVPVAPQEKE